MCDIQKMCVFIYFVITFLLPCKMVVGMVKVLGCGWEGEGSSFGRHVVIITS
jgi:hypothetical protein